MLTANCVERVFVITLAFNRALAQSFVERNYGDPLFSERRAPVCLEASMDLGNISIQQFVEAGLRPALHWRRHGT